MIETPTEGDRHKFNNDLLLDEEDRAKARRNWPRVADAFIDEELAKRFVPIDDRANTAKRRSRLSGRVAVFLGVLALIGMSSSPLYHHAPSPWPTFLDIFAAALGIASVLIAVFGILHSAGKQRWLAARWQTERLRQFHFQYNVSHLTEIVAVATEPGAYESLHKRRANESSIRIPNEDSFVKKRLDNTVGFETREEAWLTDQPASNSGTEPDALVLEEFFNAYRELRIRHQISYTRAVLGLKPGPMRTTLQQHQHRLERLGTYCILLLFALHLLVVGGAIAGWPAWVAGISHSPWTHAIAIWLAAIALGARVLEGGYGLRVDSARYSDYLFNLIRLEEDFDRDKSFAHRLSVMRRVEELSFQEMVSFLRSATAAQYVI